MFELRYEVQTRLLLRCLPENVSLQDVTPPPLGRFSGLWHGKRAADLLAQKVGDLDVTGHGLHVTRAWILPQQMGCPLAFEDATVAP